jgi:tetratricopeptide (TPR) repeat protein/transcriptional regulator with XRE-family HTH domain
MAGKTDRSAKGEVRGPKISVLFDGKRLTSARWARSWTQEELAEEAGISEISVRRAERSVPVSREIARAIAIALQIPLETLLIVNDSLSTSPDHLEAEPVPLFGGVPPRYRNFIGRDDELAQLHSILTEGRPAAITQQNRAAVQGMGGVGKTALATEYAHGYRSHYVGVWWCSAETNISLFSSLSRLAIELGVVGEAEANVEKAAKAALHHLGLAAGPFLLIFDGVSSPQEIRDLLPSANARLLITSRFFDWSSWAEEVVLDVLPLTKAVAFLHMRASREDEAGATYLAEALGRLPLALEHAAAYCKQRKISFAEYAAKVDRLIAVAPRGTPYLTNVYVTFSIAISDVVEQCTAAQPLMDYLAWCAPERIPLTLINGSIADEAELLDTALVSLMEVSLVRHDVFEDLTPAITVHRLVQLVARALANAGGRSTRACEMLIKRLVKIYPEDAYQNASSWLSCAQLTPHLRHVQSYHAPSREVAALLNRAGGYLESRAIYADARELYETSLSIINDTFGPEDPGTTVVRGNLANLLHAQGELVKARQLFEELVAVQGKVLGPEHPETITVLNNFAQLLRAQGDLIEAKQIHQHVVATRIKILGLEHPQTADSLNNLALVTAEQGDLTAAKTLHELTLSTREKILGPTHPNTAGSLNNLASVLEDLGELSRAQQLYEHAVTTWNESLGPEHPHVAMGLNNLAHVLQAQGKLDEARTLYERALEIRENTLGLMHPDTAMSVNNLGDVLQAQGDLNGAWRLFKRALEVWDKVLDPEHP